MLSPWTDAVTEVVWLERALTLSRTTLCCEVSNTARLGFSNCHITTSSRAAGESGQAEGNLPPSNIDVFTLLWQAVRPADLLVRSFQRASKGQRPKWPPERGRGQSRVAFGMCRVINSVMAQTCTERREEPQGVPVTKDHACRGQPSDSLEEAEIRMLADPFSKAPLLEK